MKTLILLIALALVQAAANQPAPPTARELAPGTYLVPGAVPADRGPDGNSVIVVGPAGLDRRQATEYATHYVGFLRKGSGASPDCQAK